MAEARKAMSDLLGRLHQTHFGIIPVDAYQEVDENSPSAVEGSTGIDVRVVGGEALVTAVDAGSPAAKAGLRPDDLIVYVNGEQVISVKAFRTAMSQYQPGQEVTLEIRRAEKDSKSEKLVTVKLMLTERPKPKR